MINPRHCVELLLLNAPSENAVPAFDLLIWFADLYPALKDNDEFLEAWDLAYSNLDHHNQARDAHAKERVEHPAREDHPQSVEAIAANGSH